MTDWIGERPWQLAVAAVLALGGAAAIYLGAAASTQLTPLAVAGVGMFAVGLVIPLVLKVLDALGAEAGDEDA